MHLMLTSTSILSYIFIKGFGYMIIALQIYGQMIGKKNYTLSRDKEWMDQESYVYYLFEITCFATRCHPFFKH